jgi:hypothetical protein
VIPAGVCCLVDLELLELGNALQSWMLFSINVIIRKKFVFCNVLVQKLHHGSRRQRVALVLVFEVILVMDKSPLQRFFYNSYTKL